VQNERKETADLIIKQSFIKSIFLPFVLFFLLLSNINVFVLLFLKNVNLNIMFVINCICLIAITVFVSLIVIYIINRYYFKWIFKEQGLQIKSVGINLVFKKTIVLIGNLNWKYSDINTVALTNMGRSDALNIKFNNGEKLAVYPISDSCMLKKIIMGFEKYLGVERLNNEAQDLLKTFKQK